MNPSKRYQTMAMRVRSGTPYGVHGHGSTRAESVRRAEPLVLVRVVSDWSGSGVPIFAHAEEGVDARSNRAGCRRLISEFLYGFPWIALLWLSRVRTIWVACRKCSIGASAGRSRSPTMRTKSRRGKNWNVQQ